jgi:hypothetical protein
VSEASGRVAAIRLAEFLTDVYAAAGLPAADAASCAAQTVAAELRGVASHGCVRVSVFVERLRRGTVNPTPRRPHRTRPLRLRAPDGDRGMSAVGGRRAMDAAMSKASANGIGAAVDSSCVPHRPRRLAFAAMALAGMIGIVASSAAANLAPWAAPSACSVTTRSRSIPSDETIRSSRHGDEQGRARLRAPRRETGGDAIPEGGRSTPTAARPPTRGAPSPARCCRSASTRARTGAGARPR